MIANASAGATADEVVDLVAARLRTRAHVEIVRPDQPADLLDVLRGRSGREVIVLGGDGSVHLVAQSLYDLGDLTDAILGLIPLGTGNDLARTLGLPLDPADAAEIVLDGSSRQLDLLVDDTGGVVVNAAHVGVGAEAGKAAADLKSSLGKLAYAAGAAKAGASIDGWKLEVLVDGETINDAATAVLMVGIANGGSIGGGTQLAPDASPDDGLADVIVSRAIGPLARVGYAAQLTLGRHGARDDVIAVRGREARITGEPAPINVDGELEDDVTNRIWKVLPRAWRVISPRQPR
jgi:YegS/Rv2252/BmrU family lipid kinase